QRLGLMLIASYDDMLALSSDYDPPSAFRTWIERARTDCEPLAKHLPIVSMTLAMHQAHYAIEANDGDAALALIEANQHIKSFFQGQTFRARFAAMSLGAQ